MSEPLPTLFDGITINDERDNGRLNKQFMAVKMLIVNYPGWLKIGRASCRERV